MDFDKMLEKSEYMFITLSKNKEGLALFDDLSKFSPKTKVIIVANGFEDVAKRMAELVEAGKLGGVAFESDDLSKEHKGNVFVTPHNAYYTKESLEKMFEIWVNTMISAAETPINRVN
jgi:phosphoglycerate dehydrogenase-like enzyme